MFYYEFTSAGTAVAIYKTEKPIRSMKQARLIVHNWLPWASIPFDTVKPISKSRYRLLHWTNEELMIK